MKARITKKDGYSCAPNGYAIVTFPYGVEVEGQVAEWAVSDMAARRLFDKRKGKKVITDVETKGAI
jgi:hypothetical protein